MASIPMLATFHNGTMRSRASEDPVSSLLLNGVGSLDVQFSDERKTEGSVWNGGRKLIRQTLPVMQIPNGSLRPRAFNSGPFGDSPQARC